MKRFLVFYGEEYFPEKAWIDFRGDYGTLEEAIESMPIKYKNHNSYWHQIVDTETKQVVSSF